jgi:murein DD-endopeptidase MepM/ murein hydrolase activator NlpD
VETFSQAALLVVAMIVFANYRNGTLGQWFGAKFMNKAAPEDPGQSFLGQVLHGKVPGVTTAAASVDSSTSSRTIAYAGDKSGLGSLVMPVAGASITGSFGETRPGHLHEGIDLAVPTGTPVDAARGGRVIYAGPSGGYGIRVDVDHGNGIVTRYGHLSKLLVTLGQSVTPGQQIALSGSTGHSTGPHLHFELRQGGVPINPAPYLPGLVGAA